jgi:hypothetical protein
VETLCDNICQNISNVEPAAFQLCQSSCSVGGASDAGQLAGD